VDACRLLKEVNTLLTSRVSGIHEVRARGSTSKLMKRREGKSARVRPIWWSRMEGVDKRRSHTHIGISGITKLKEEESEFRLANL
jgi:hypothetical protein